MSVQSRPRLLFLTPHLGGGGAESVIATLACHVDHEKYDVHLGIVTSQLAAGSPELPPWVTVHRLCARRVRSSAVRLSRLVWRLRPAVILSGMAHLNALVLLMRPFLPPRTRFIARQNGSARAMLSATRLRAARLLFRIAYRRAHHIICQTDAMALELERLLDLHSEDISVLANPVDVESIRRCARQSKRLWSGPGPNLLAVGRLSYEKGFDLLLEAFARVHQVIPSSELVIAGVGRCDAELKRRSCALGIADCVRFPGYVPSPAAYFSGATVFVLPSREEGLPNALLEAAAGGLPIVALPSNRGIVDLLQDRFGVWIAPGLSAQALQDTLLNALPVLHPTERYVHPWIDQFELHTAIAAYELILARTLSGEGR